MFENGAYVLAKHNYIVIVIDDMAVGYSISWYGDLAEWEIYGYTDEAVDVSGCSGIPNMISCAFGLHWEPYEDEVEFYPADELPFDTSEFPPISETHPNGTSNILRNDSPVLDWAFEIGLVD